MREFVDGAEAIARGAIAAGCTFFAGYPISPATPILLHMVRELPKVGGVAIQAEDEISAMGFCIGAAMAGAKVMTATSGPGISLSSEHIGLAIMGEVPMVIVDCQRLGPATGGATTVAQGDIQFVRWGTSGGYPIIALCPTGVADCFSLTIEAFNLAERFRVPVFLLADKEVVATAEVVEEDVFRPIPVVPRRYASPHIPFIPYHVEQLADVPPMSPIGGPHILRFTSSTHDEWGYLTKDPEKVDRLNRHLAAKVEAHADEIGMVATDLQRGASTLILSYGVTARSAREAVKLAREEGIKVSLAIVHTLWPVPVRALRRALQEIRRVVVAELNLGLYRREIERIAGGCEVVGVHRVDGELITPQEILKVGGIL
ncbi:MAG: 2-oxoacid:acceptor oxidoreductase subunit alpha [Armatimonadota bacterium]|nr:2-oxoacid:acceptor oxidoreductase subunit alpha [Armatimonadota bacterium]